MNRRDQNETDRRREAEAALDRVERDAEVVGSSGFARTLRRAGDRLEAHFGGADADPADRIEVWGRRIGRILALLAAVLLLSYLLSGRVPI